MQERIPGVGLDVAWQYMSKLKKTFFKDQARDILQKLREIKPDDAHATLSYVVADPDPVLHRGISETEHNLLGTPPAERSRGISLMHNDMVKSNLIVMDGEIVGVVDWEMAGFFAWEAASVVHDKIRSPQAEDLQLLELDEETVKDRLFWNDLYHI
jgi:COMPASS component SPP1